MRRSFKYRIYPNKIQQAEFQKIFSFYTFLYNSALQKRISFYKKYGKGISYVAQAAYLKEIKQEFKDQTENIYFQTLQYVLKKLDSSYKNFFKRPVCLSEDNAWELCMQYICDYDTLNYCRI